MKILFLFPFEVVSFRNRNIHSRTPKRHVHGASLLFGQNVYWCKLFFFENDLKIYLFLFFFNAHIKLPKFIGLPFVFVTIIYWMTNLNNSVGSFFLCCFIIILVANTAVAFGKWLLNTTENINKCIWLFKIVTFKAHFYR